MGPSLITAACPCCKHRWEFPDTTTSTRDALEEVVCPCCRWEFALDDEDGHVLDDGDLDVEGPFHVDDEGELSAENLLSVRCPVCTRAAEVTEDDRLRCPGCRHTFEVEGGRVRRPGFIAHPEGIDPADEDELYYFYDLQTCCPRCDEGYWDDDGFVTSLIATADGRVLCTHCGESFEDRELYEELLGGQGGPVDLSQREPIVVAADGGGHYTSLPRAHRLLQYDGGRIRVRPGRYAGDLDSYGERLVLEADGPAGEVVVPGKLRFHGGRVVVRGLTLTGEVLANQGRLTLIDCTLRGARLTARGIRADLRLRRCRIEGAPAAGVLVTEAASARLTDCAVTAGRGAGVLVAHGAWACLEDCRVTDNAGHGVRAERDTTLLLRRCAVARNRGGVALLGGRAVLAGCRLSGHRRAGIQAAGRARLIVLRTFVSGGRSAGVRLRDAARAVLCRTAVEGQAGSGIEVRGRARAAFRRCTVTDNGGAGVRVGRRAVASVRGLTCAGNARGDWDVTPGGMVRALTSG